jgi:hypothetical protein
MEKGFVTPSFAVVVGRSLLVKGVTNPFSIFACASGIPQTLVRGSIVFRSLTTPYQMKFLFIAVSVFASLPVFSEGLEEKRICRIIFVDRPHDAPKEAHLFDGTASRKVELPSMNFTESVSLPAGELTLMLTPDSVEKAGNFPPEAPTAKVAAQVKDFFLIVVSDPDNRILPVRMLPVEQGVESPEPGQTLWINLTEHKISASFGSESLEVSAGDKVLGKAPLAANGYFKAEFLYQPQSEGEFLPLMKKSWWFDATSANLGFIIDSGGRLPRVFTFRDFRSPASAKKPE